MVDRQASIDVMSLVVRDNLPPGASVSLAGVNPLVSFASLFRDELQAQGFGVLPQKEVRRGRKRLD